MDHMSTTLIIILTAHCI